MSESSNKLGDYVILEKIAHGGMAEIYKAKTSDIHGIERLVVIKRILPHIASQAEYVDMLVDEAKIAVHFTHGNIAQVYDLGKVGEDYFIVMEYVDGKTVAQILRQFRETQKPLPLDILIYSIMEIARALDYIHDKTDKDGNSLGVVHRDISPQNIIISYSGTVKVIDFGVAKSLDKLHHTESGVLKGKFAYMSPEQAQGKAIDRRSDIFSLGILFWEMLTQARLFKRSTNKDTIQAVLKYKPAPPSAFRKDIPQELDAIIEKALRKRKWLRYQNASDMASDLARLLWKYFPDFKPVVVADFLYKNFGSEPDEEGLPLEIPPLPKVSEAKTVAVGPKKEVKNLKYWFHIFKNGIYHFFQKKVAQWILFSILTLLCVMGLISLWPSSPFIEVTFKVKPQNALVEIDQKEATPIALGLYKIKIKEHDEVAIKVSLKGYQTYETLLSADLAETDYLISLEEQNVALGLLSVQTSPSGAVVYINDIEWKQKTPVKIDQLQQNKKYRIGLFKEDYQFVEKQIELGSREQNLFVALEPHYAILDIRVLPQSAQIKINHLYRGQSPLILNNIKPNENIELSIDAEGYESLRQVFQLRSGEKKALSFELKKL